MTNKSPVFLLLMSLAFTANAQQTWSLKDCISYGLQNHRSNALVDDDKKAAEAQARVALAGYLPSFNVTASLDDNIKLQESEIPAGILGPKPLKISLSEKYNSIGMIELDQPIYDQSLLTGLRANKINALEADLNIQQNKETIVYNVGTAYYQIYVYREQLALLKINLETYKRQLDLFGLKVKKGIALESDMNKVKVNYNNTRSQLSVAESNLIFSQNQLKNAMGFPMNSTLLVDSVPAGSLAELEQEKGKETFTAAARSDYRLALANVLLLTVDQKRIKAEALPKLTAYAKYGGVGFGETLGPAVNQLNGFMAVGVKLTIPLLDFYKHNAQYDEAKYKTRDAEEIVKLDADKFRLDFENARTKMVKAASDVGNDGRNIELARQVFATTDLQYQKGVTDLTDWLNSESSLKEAQNNFLNSLYNFFLARLDLEKAKGSLINYYQNL